jgi:hypothetical protein
MTKTATTTKMASSPNNEDGNKFVVKDIVVKKKNPQQKLEKYFEVKKKTRTNQVTKKNFQGFPLSQCRYKEEIGQYIYCPPCYTQKNKKGSVEQDLCRECLLRPCIVRGKWNDIMNFCEDIMIFENDDSDSMYFKMLNHAESLLVEIFGARYATTRRPPGCLFELVGNYHSVKSGMEAEVLDDHPDDDLVANATDGGDYLEIPLQNNCP